MLSLLMMAGATGCAAKINPRESLAAQGRAPEGSPRLLAIYQPWFGQSAHSLSWYSCHDPNVLRQQIAKAKELNISGFVVNWYGPRKEFEDQAYGLMQQAASADPSFKVAAQYDEAVDHPGYDTDAVIVDLQYLYDRYIGPHAGPTRSAYLRYNGRPVIFIFPKDSAVDWNRVRQVTNSWEDPPLMFYKDINNTYPAAFDGFYPWVQPGKDGWARDGSHDGQNTSIISTVTCRRTIATSWPWARCGRALTIAKLHGAGTGTLHIDAAKRLKTCCGCSANITDRRMPRRICWWKPGMTMKKAPTWSAA